MGELVKELNERVTVNNLLDPEIIKLSQKLDLEIVQAQKEKLIIIDSKVKY